MLHRVHSLCRNPSSLHTLVHHSPSILHILGPYQDSRISQAHSSYHFSIVLRICFHLLQSDQNMVTLDTKLTYPISSIISRADVGPGCTAPSLEELYHDLMEKKNKHIQSDPSHPQSSNFEKLPSESRLRTIYCRTARFRKCFVPSVVRHLNYL